MKDLRDPQALGEELLLDAKVTRGQATLSQLYDRHVRHLEIPDYDGGGLMSSDPAKHHSKVKQDVRVESDGGE